MFIKNFSLKGVTRPPVHIFALCDVSLSVLSSYSDGNSYEITCVDYDGTKHVLHILKQKGDGEVFIQDKEGKFLLVKVATIPEEKPNTWLVIDTAHKFGYLYPMKSFLTNLSHKHVQDLPVHVFAACDGILTLARSCNEDGYSEIKCRDYDEADHVLYVPQQERDMRKCEIKSSHVGNRDDEDESFVQGIENRYLFVRVSSIPPSESSPNVKPNYWLVTETVNNFGYLYPIDTFQGN